MHYLKKSVFKVFKYPFMSCKVISACCKTIRMFYGWDVLLCLFQKRHHSLWIFWKMIFCSSPIVELCIESQQIHYYDNLFIDDECVYLQSEERICVHTCSYNLFYHFFIEIFIFNLCC